MKLNTFVKADSSGHDISSNKPFLIMCSSRKYPYSPHRRNWNFLGVGGFCKTKNLKKCMKLKWNFQRGWGVLEKIPSVGEVWIFSGITQSYSLIFEYPSVKT